MKLRRSILLPGALLALVLTAPLAKADNIVEVADKAGSFKTLLAAAKAAGLADALATTKDITVFAPTDEAFAKLPKGTVESLLKPENKEKLAAILKYHVIKGKVMAADVVKLKNGTKVDTLEGAKITIKVKPSVMVNNAKVVKTDIAADNGVIHVIDHVLLPPAPKMKKGK